MILFVVLTTVKLSIIVIDTLTYYNLKFNEKGAQSSRRVNDKLKKHRTITKHG